MPPSLESLLRDLDFHPNERRVYSALTALGEARASTIAKKANLPRTTTISILEKFRENQWISAHTYHGAKTYWIEAPDVLAHHFLQKAELAKQLGGLFTDLYRSQSIFPMAEIHDTRSSIRAFIEKTILHLPLKSALETIDSPSEGNYAKIYSSAVEQTLFALKKKRQLHTRTLIPHGTSSGINPKKLRLQSIELRELPAGLDFHASLWIVGDMIVHFSGNPPFVVAIKHPQITKSMSGLYQFLWKFATSPNEI